MIGLVVALLAVSVLCLIGSVYFTIEAEFHWRNVERISKGQPRREHRNQTVSRLCKWMGQW